MNDIYENVDAVCAVLAPRRSREVINLVLTTFIPAHEHLNCDYAGPPEDPDRMFASEDEMIDYFVGMTTSAQTFFWNQNEDNPDRIMVGAFLTTDEHLIMSVTVPADGERERTCLARLKALLSSNIGVVSYTDPPPFDDGADFIKKYSPCQRPPTRASRDTSTYEK